MQFVQRNAKKRQGESQKGIAVMRYVLVRKADRKEWNFKRLPDLISQLIISALFHEKMPVLAIEALIDLFYEHDKKEKEFHFTTSDYEFIIRAEKGEENV